MPAALCMQSQVRISDFYIFEESRIKVNYMMLDLVDALRQVVIAC